MVDKSNQESTNSFVNFFTCLLLMSFHYFTFFCTGEGFSFLTQQYNNSMYNKSYKWIPHELSFNKIEIDTNLEVSLGVFWSQN